jgi:hypothetical protein
VTDSPYTENMFDIAVHLATKIMDAPDVWTAHDLTYLIERELDKYIEEGSLRFAKPVNRR